MGILNINDELHDKIMHSIEEIISKPLPRGQGVATLVSLPAVVSMTIPVPINFDIAKAMTEAWEQLENNTPAQLWPLIHTIIEEISHEGGTDVAELANKLGCYLITHSERKGIALEEQVNIYNRDGQITGFIVILAENGRSSLTILDLGPRCTTMRVK
jgi:hypothetical protein